MSGKEKKKSRQRVFIPYEKEKKGPSWVGIVIMWAIWWPIGLFMLGKKAYAAWHNRKNIDYRNYAAIIGDRCEIDIAEISAKSGKTPSLVMSDLQVMIDKGYLGSNAYLDRSRRVLVLDALEVEFVEEEPEDTVIEVNIGKQGFNAQVKRPEEKQEAPVKEEKSEPQPQPEYGMQEDDFEARLREIRKLNDEIDDEGVSNRIDRIGELTASIFTVVRQKPERADEVKKFMNYYLPTTFKLLKSYALMEKQSYQGQNITASRKKIEDILDSLITAFEQQQDRLFRTEALDVEADIQVLETMMAKDGLVTPKGLDLRSMGGH